MAMPDHEHDDQRRARSHEQRRPPPEPVRFDHPEPVARALAWLERVAQDATARIVLDVQERAVGWDGLPHHEEARTWLSQVRRHVARGAGRDAAVALAWGLAYVDAALDGCGVADSFAQRAAEVSERVPGGWIPPRRERRRVS
jgi:hypothetical protein